jgi:hypothetical protein
VQRRTLPLAVGLLAALATSATHQSLQAKRADFPADEDLLYLPAPQDLRRMSIGYREALADLIWIRAVIFAGSELVGEHYSWIGDYLEAINCLAPTFRQPYAWGSKITIYTGGALGRGNVELAEKLLRAGLVKFPEDHELLFSLGMTLRTEKSEGAGFTAEEIAAAQDESVRLIRKAAAFGAPSVVRQLAASFIDENADIDLRIAYLEEQLLTSEDERHKRYLRNRLDELGKSDNYQRMLELRAQFDVERMSQFPYLREHEYALIRDEVALKPSEPDAKASASLR